MDKIFTVFDPHPHMDKKKHFSFPLPMPVVCGHCRYLTTPILAKWFLNALLVCMSAPAVFFLQELYDDTVFNLNLERDTLKMDIFFSIK